MVRFVADGQEIFRVLKETEDGVWVIRYNNPNTPLLLSWPAMSTQMQDVEIPDDFLDESEFSPHIRVPAGRGKGDNMYHLTMTKTQAALIPKAVELYNQVRNNPKYREYGKRFFAGVDKRYTEYARSLEGKLGIPHEKLTPLIFILVRACVHYALFEDEFYLQAQLSVLKETLAFYIEKYEPQAKQNASGDNKREETT